MHTETHKLIIIALIRTLPFATLLNTWITYEVIIDESSKHIGFLGEGVEH